MASKPNVAGVVLAAGKGTRMKSDLPKGLFRVCGVPMVSLVCEALRRAGAEQLIVVKGHGGQALQDALEGQGLQFACQESQLGTGHALQCAMRLLKGFGGTVIVAPGDTPLLDSAPKRLLDSHLDLGADLTVGTFKLEQPAGYGRIVRDEAGSVLKVVEDRDARPEELRIEEVNSGLYAVEGQVLADLLPRLGNANAQGEYYLTDLVSLAASGGFKVRTAEFDDPQEIAGVNDRWQLAQATAALKERILKGLALAGVTIEDPANTYVDVRASIGAETVLHPGTIIEGETQIGPGCEIGPFTRITDSEIGDGCVVTMSQVNRARLGAGVRCGPFANVRPGSEIGERSRIGNFVEVKNSVLKPSVSVSHLTYLGDSEIGENTNIGAGTITCNYDGYDKKPTVIGAGAFIGSNTTLIAPVTIGERAFVAAGSVITNDVEAGSLAVARSRQEVKEGWADRWRNKKRSP